MIADIIIQMLGPIWPYIVGAGTAIMGLVLAYWRGGSAAKAKATAKQAEADAKAYRDTIEKVTNETLSGDPADAIRKRLRERADR